MQKIQYWLMKSEPSTYSIDDLQRDGFTDWEGVRNFQVRNMLRDEMRPGDLALFYHSNAKPPGVAGICRICEVGKADESQWDPSSPYYDKKAAPGNPIWFVVEVEFVEKFPRLVPLAELRDEDALKRMPLLQKGSRLSITPLTQDEYDTICALAHKEAAEHKAILKQRL